MARTEEQMKEALKDELYIGRKVRVEKFQSLDERDRGNTKETKRGRVEGLYPHIFTVRFGERLEAFQYSQVFIKERGRVILS